MNIVKPVRVANASKFSKTADLINEVMAGYGYRRKDLAGSVSWLGHVHTPQEHQTIFKLVQRPGELIFVARQSLIDTSAKLRKIIWPIEVGFAAAPDIKFVGFRAGSNAGCLDRIRRVLSAIFPVPDPTKRIGIHDEAAERSLDEQLNSLNDDNVFAAASVASIAKVLPAEDFSDWEK